MPLPFILAGAAIGAAGSGFKKGLDSAKSGRAYCKDPDLEFLADVPNDDLDALVQILTIKNADGDKRLTEELTKHDRYKKFSPDHHAYWDLIAAEIQCKGANTMATLFRGGKGVLYKEVLTDVCDKMKVKYNRSSSVETIELHLLMKVLTDSMEKMNPEDLEGGSQNCLDPVCVW